MNKFLDYLHLRNAGGLEMLYAMFLILSSYTVAGIPFSTLVPVLMIILALRRRGRLLGKCKPLLFFIGYYFIHQIVWLIAMPYVPGYYFNSIISTFVFLISILIVGEKINYNHLLGSINWIAIISMFGMLYHYLIMLRGGDFQPISLPFMSSFNEAAIEGRVRPCSFYSEPSEYAAFMLIPLFLSLFERKYIWSGLILVTIFMSSSTTGLIQSFLVIILYIFTQKIGKKTKFLIIILSCAMAFLLIQSPFFSQSTDKLENTNLEETTRTIQGPIVVSSMRGGDFVFGVPYANAYEYCIHSSVANDVIYYGKTVYLPTFWNAILLVGIVGLILYLNIYYFYIKRNRFLLPFLLALIPTFFSSAYFIGAYFCYQFIFVLAFHKKFRLNNGFKE